MTATPGHHPRLHRWLFACCYAASGAAALIYQVAWTRLFTLQLGHTVAASSTVLAAFMGGLAVGAWAAGRWKFPVQRALIIYGALELLIAAAAIVLPTLLHATRPLLVSAYADGAGHAPFAILRVFTSVALLGIPAAAMGATFPVTAVWITSRSGLAIDSAILYAANSAG